MRGEGFGMSWKIFNERVVKCAGNNGWYAALSAIEMVNLLGKMWLLINCVIYFNSTENNMLFHVKDSDIYYDFYYPLCVLFTHSR